MFPMKLKSFNYLIGLLIIFLCSPILSEEKIEIWKNKKEAVIGSSKEEDKNTQGKINLQKSQTIKALEKIESFQSYRSLRSFGKRGGSEKIKRLISIFQSFQIF